MSLCQIVPIRQITTSADAPDAVVRDLQQLFSAVNSLIACGASVSTALNSLTGGSFASGDGSASQSSTPQAQQLQGPARYSSAVDIVLADGFNGVALIDATADINVQLPVPAVGNVVQIVNVNATYTITVKDNAGSTVNPPVLPGGRMTPWQQEDSASLPTWAASSLVHYPDGTVHIYGSMVYIEAGTGPYVQSPNAHFQLITSDNSSVVGATDAGTPIPL